MSDNSKTKYLTENEFNRLIRAIEKTKDGTEGKYWQRDKLMFLLGFEAGLRATEVGNLKVEDFNNGNELYCKRLKGSYSNTIRLTHGTAALLTQYIKEYPNNGEYIFMSRKSEQITSFTLNKLCKKYFKLAKLPPDKAHFHSIKHTAGVYLAEQGLDIKDVQFVLGHKSTDNTMIYFKFTTKQQEAMYKKLGR
jgi:site-specific recombinase XerD